MSISTSTAAQRITLRDKTRIAGVMLQAFAQDSVALNAEQITDVDAALTNLTAALSAAGGILLPATQVIVSNGGAVTITDSAGGPSLAGTATVAAGALSSVAITAATAAIVQNADTVPVKSFAGAVVTAAPTAEVSAGALVAVKLSSAAAVAANTVKQSVGTVSGSGTFGTFTVSGGVITGIVLSAS